MKKQATTPAATKIGKGNIQQIIKEEAQVIKRKREIYEQIKAFNTELGELNKKGLGKLGLNERTMMVGAQGFGAAPGAPKANPTGFVYPQNISRVAELEAELAPEETVVLDGSGEKEVMGDPSGKPMVDADVKKQLIDMKEKLEMILSSLGGGEAVVAPGGEEAAQAAAQTETPTEPKSDESDEEETPEEEKEEEEDEDGGETEGSSEEEEEIVIKEGKYSMTLSHDGGKKKITTTGSDKEAAIKKVMKAEGCPRNAISNVIEK